MVDSTNLPEVDINAIATDLNNKMDKDGVNAECPVVISRTANSNGGVTEIWSDGYCVQNGIISVKTTGSTTLGGTVYYGVANVNFNNTYLNTPTIQLTSQDNGGGVYLVDYNSVSVSQIEVQLIGSNNNITCSVQWEAKGYIR